MNKCNQQSYPYVLMLCMSVLPAVFFSVYSFTVEGFQSEIFVPWFAFIVSVIGWSILKLIPACLYALSYKIICNNVSNKYMILLYIFVLIIAVEGIYLTVLDLSNLYYELNYSEYLLHCLSSLIIMLSYLAAIKYFVRR